MGNNAAEILSRFVATHPQPGTRRVVTGGPAAGMYRSCYQTYHQELQRSTLSSEQSPSPDA
ncbi:MAG: hypothetical protein AB1758_34855 [Candidatus Eremiobacterota bacterium]